MRARFGNDGPKNSQQIASKQPANSQQMIDVSPVQAVFLAWLCFQSKPGACKLTKARKRLIERALVDYDADDLATLINYAYQADEPGPLYWRGENHQGRRYMDLTNLLANSANAAGRLSARVESATVWAARTAGEPEMTDAEATATLAALARRAPGATPGATPAATTGPSQGLPERPRRMARWGDDE